MSETINSINQRTDTYAINNGQDGETKVNITKTMGKNGITSISYVDKNGYIQFIDDSKDNLLDEIFNSGKSTEEMITQLCNGQTPEALKKYSAESMSILNGLIDYVKGNIKTNDNASAAASADLKSLLGNFSNFDIRELMKLLIQAFAQFFTTQRELDLMTITQIQQAMKAKIDAMEEEKNAAYKAAKAQAIGGIISGAFSIAAGCASCVGGVLSTIGGFKGTSILNGKSKTGTIQAHFSNESGEITNNAKTKLLESMANTTMKKWDGMGTTWSGVGQALNGAGGLANGMEALKAAGYKADEQDAKIKQAEQDAVLEILKKMQQDGSEQTKQLMEFIARILSMIQELQQAAAQTEKTIVQA